MLIRVYKIFWDDCDDFYIGSTKQSLSLRMTKHRDMSKKNSNSNLHCLIREKGIHSFKYVLVESFEVNDREEQNREEQKCIDEMKPTLNQQKAFRSIEDNKAYHQEYNQKNKEINRQKAVERRLTDPEKIRAQARESRNRNIEKARARDRERAKNPERKEQRKVKITCPCGKTILKCNISTHKKTQHHKLWEESAP